MQVRNCHVDKAVAKMTSIRYVDTALFYVYLDFFCMERMSVNVQNRTEQNRNFIWTLALQAHRHNNT